MTSVRLPHCRLAELWPTELNGARVGAVVHPASVLPDFTHLADLLQRTGSPWILAALFGPQHGILGHTQDNMIEWEGDPDPRWKVPVHSLYGQVRKPTPQMLEGLDALVIDLQDVGARYYTFIWTMLLCLEAAWEKGLAVVVLDRPNPLGGVKVEGPTLDKDYKSFVGMHTVPVRHGLTMGEMALLLAAEKFPGLSLSCCPWRDGREACFGKRPVFRGCCPALTCRPPTRQASILACAYWRLARPAKVAARHAPSKSLEDLGSMRQNSKPTSIR